MTDILKGEINTMVKGKIAGLAFGGLAGYLIIGKVINSLERNVAKVCEARKWANYYKYGGVGMVAPGYSMHTSTKNDAGETIIVDTEKKRTFTNSTQNGPVATSIKDAIKDAIDKRLRPEEAKEGQTEASEEDICCNNCYTCKNSEQCPFEDVRKGGVITDWGNDETGKFIPVAGRYYPVDNNCEPVTWDLGAVNLQEEVNAGTGDADDSGLEASDGSFDYGENNITEMFDSNAEENDETVD